VLAKMCDKLHGACRHMQGRRELWRCSHGAGWLSQEDAVPRKETQKKAVCVACRLTRQGQGWKQIALRPGGNFDHQPEVLRLAIATKVSGQGQREPITGFS